MDSTVERIFGNKLRTRVCGLCWHNDRLLMVNHKLGQGGVFWAPPGGGIEFGQPAHIALQKEIKEETGLEVEIGRLSFACELIRHPLHAIELFFNVTRTGGELTRGIDPEITSASQIIQQVCFLSWPEIMAMDPVKRHGIFNQTSNRHEFEKLSGFYRI